MKVLLLDLKAQYLTIKEEIKSAIDEVLESQIFILGPKVEELEKSVAAYSGTKYGIGVSSGLIEKGLTVPPRAVYKNGGDKDYHIYNQYTIRTKNRDELQAHLKKNAIGSEIYYPLPLHLQECFKELGYRRGDLPVSEEAAESVLSIPIYPELTAEQRDYIFTTIAGFYA